MQASIENFLNGVLNNQRNYYIPVYQRNYSWTEKQCEVLFNDIIKLYNAEYEEHFIGSIVWKPDESNSQRLGIIDGQQRLTTMFLLIKALHDCMDEENKFKEKLYDILVDRYNENMRLELIKADNLVFSKIINNEIEEVDNKASRVYLNYIYFKNRLEKEKISYDKFFDNFVKLKIIKMELDYKDKPQIIFESINSTGMSLSIADLIRNFLLMNENKDKQEYLFEKYWYKFETKLGVEDLVSFFEHYLNINIPNIQITRNEMYNIFKSYYSKLNLSTEEVLQMFEADIKAYEYLVANKKFELSSKEKTIQINTLCSDIKSLKNTVSRMFLYPTIKDYLNEVITEDNLIYAFEMTSSYIFRRAVIGVATNAMQKVFRYLYRQVNDNKDKYGYKDALNYSLIVSKRKTTGQFPEDKEFHMSLTSRNLYGRFRYTEFLLRKLENYNNKTTFEMEDFTIEHIMPQTLNSSWKEIIGPNYKVLHEENVNDLGNLTLTSYNSNMSNFDFSKKKEILNEESHIKLNEYLKDINIWDIKSIQKRGEYLATISLNIWKYPKINEKMKEEVEAQKYNVTTLEELLINYESLKFTEIKLYEYSSKIKSYRDILEHIVIYVNRIDSEKFNNIFVDSKSHIRTVKGEQVYLFSKTNLGDNYKRYEQEFSIYMFVNMSGRDILNIVHLILDEFNINSSDVELSYYQN